MGIWFKKPGKRLNREEKKVKIKEEILVEFMNQLYQRIFKPRGISLEDIDMEEERGKEYRYELMRTAIEKSNFVKDSEHIGIQNPYYKRFFLYFRQIPYHFEFFFDGKLYFRLSREIQEITRQNNTLKLLYVVLYDLLQEIRENYKLYGKHI